MLEMVAGNKIVVAVLALLVAVGAWYMLGGGGEPTQEAGLVTETFTSPTSEADRDLVATLLQLRSVNLDGTIFNDPVFKSLKDVGSQIIPEPVGRPNPFAPLQTASVGATGGTSTQPRAQAPR